MGIDIEITRKTVEALLAAAAEIGICVDESVLYADQNSYEQLRLMNEKYRRIRSRIENETSVQALAREGAALVADNDAVSRMIQETLHELSKPTRKMLGLKALRLKK
jgi:hypothetical protein